MHQLTGHGLAARCPSTCLTRVGGTNGGVIRDEIPLCDHRMNSGRPVGESRPQGSQAVDEPIATAPNTTASSMGDEVLREELVGNFKPARFTISSRYRVTTLFPSCMDGSYHLRSRLPGSAHKRGLDGQDMLAGELSGPDQPAPSAIRINPCRHRRRRGVSRSRPSVTGFESKAW